MALESVGGAALEAAFGELLKAVLGPENTIVGIKPYKINSITPTIKQIEDLKKESNHPKEELDGLIKQLKKGEKIVLECLMVSRWNYYTKAAYTKKLLELANDVRAQLDRINVRESIGLVGFCGVPDSPAFTVGLDVPLKELKMRLLKDGEPPMLVLSAPGGCGKTTLVKKFCQDEEIKRKFKNNIFFVTVSNTPILKVIIQKLFRRKSNQAPEFQNDEDAVNQLEQLPKRRGPDPVLLVLDDVWSGSESVLLFLEKIVFQIPDYKILATSRSVFPRFDSTYKLKMLNDEDSMTLFCHSAFPQNGIFYLPDEEDLLNEIVRNCKGFPLALIVVGRSLRGQPGAVWRSRVMEWSGGQSIFHSQSNILNCLKTSLDVLDKEVIVKECFMDLGSFPEDQRIPAAALIDMWVELYKLNEDGVYAKLHELSTWNLVNLITTRYGRNGAFIVDGANGHEIGKLFESDKKIAEGSNGAFIVDGANGREIGKLFDKKIAEIGKLFDKKIVEGSYGAFIVDGANGREIGKLFDKKIAEGSNGAFIVDGANGCEIGKLSVSDKKIAKGSNGAFIVDGANGREIGKLSVSDKKIVKGSNGVFFFDGTNGREIGKLFVSDKQIAIGSNGTIVFEGTYSGRSVAVKRLVQGHHDMAFQEIQNLIESDKHQNIVRLYGEEKDEYFVYLALEQCTCSLADLFQIYSDYPSQNTQFSDEYNKVRLDSVKVIMGDINLWKANRRPAPLLLKLMRDVVFGLVHLHKLKMIHRDLKPQNVLISKEESLCAKLSDMGISKRLHPDMSSLGRQATVCGTAGWKAPERLCNGRQTRALDLFSLGCVLFFCITGGGHPFGDNHFERDYNIVKNQVDLSAVEYIPEAVELFSHLLNPDPELRPKALQVLHHPLFWKSKKRLSFVRDTSDKLESEAKETNSNLLKALEKIKPLPSGATWDTKMDPAFIANIGRRRYKFDSVRDLLRVMRNNLNHYMTLPEEIKEILGPVPKGFDDYFATRFPKLLIEVYKVVCQYCKEENWCKTYLKYNV